MAVYADLFIAEYDEIVTVCEAIAVRLERIKIELILMNIKEERSLILLQTRCVSRVAWLEWKRAKTTKHFSCLSLADKKDIILKIYHFVKPITERRASI